MYRCGILLQNGDRMSKNFESKDQCETWILELIDKYDLKKSVVINKDNIEERWIEIF